LIRKLIGQLKHKDQFVRIPAILKLGKMRAISAIPMLGSTALNDTDGSFRGAAVEALGQMRHPRALALLMQVISRGPGLEPIHAAAQVIAYYFNSLISQSQHIQPIYRALIKLLSRRPISVYRGSRNQSIVVAILVSRNLAPKLGACQKQALHKVLRNALKIAIKDPTPIKIFQMTPAMRRQLQKALKTLKALKTNSACRRVS